MCWNVSCKILLFSLYRLFKLHRNIQINLPIHLFIYLFMVLFNDVNSLNYKASIDRTVPELLIGKSLKEAVNLTCGSVTTIFMFSYFVFW